MIKFDDEKSMDYISQIITILFAIFFILDFFGLNFSQQKTISNSVIQVREHEKQSFKSS